MAPSEHRSTHLQNQEPSRPKTRWRKPRTSHPRSRLCLLKGCGQTFRPKYPLARYCSEPCREQARRWRQWKARHRYRRSDGGKQKRQAQSRRYRLRRKVRQETKTVVATGARVIATQFFFVLLRPAWMLRGVPTQPTFAAETVLLPCVSPRARTGSGAGEALARTSARPAMKPTPYRPDILRDSTHSR